MLFKKADNIGTQTINKLAKIAFKKQIKKAENLTVQVDIDRQQLAKGILNSLDINGDGLIMKRNLSLEKMRITLHDVAVSPLKALMGNVELVRPSQGNASIVLNEQDIETALDLKILNERLLQYEPNSPVKFQKINFFIFADQKIEIKAQLQLLNSQQEQEICLTIKPRFCQQQQAVILEGYHSLETNHWSFTSMKTLLTEAKKIFNLNNFSVEGLCFQVKDLIMEEGKINILALAGITRLPV